MVTPSFMNRCESSILFWDFYDFYKQNEEEYIIKEQQLITEWFIECWNKAGGKEFNLPVYFGFHDETLHYLSNAKIG
ncbi:hypothetical protein SOLI23_14665 [Solibacillus silvestris]|nr:hypothetical protein SOLI23_14665 [Solibacillus silvestris]